MDEQPSRRWHIDKTISVAIIVALLVQTGGGIYLAGQFSQRQVDQERRLTLMESQNVTARLGALESQVNDVKDGVRRIDGKLDRLFDARSKP